MYESEAGFPSASLVWPLVGVALVMIVKARWRYLFCMLPEKKRADNTRTDKTLVAICMYIKLYSFIAGVVVAKATNAED